MPTVKRSLHTDWWEHELFPAPVSSRDYAATERTSSGVLSWASNSSSHNSPDDSREVPAILRVLCTALFFLVLCLENYSHFSFPNSELCFFN